jgi:parallel beta-helix repeat protein
MLGKAIMAIRRRALVAIGVFVLLGALAALGHWYESQRAQPSRTTGKAVVVRVTNADDRGPGTLREALFIAASATAPTSISIEVSQINLETALPALVNGHGVKVVGQPPRAQIDAQALNSGPVLDISGPNTSIEGITVSNCPAAAILVRAVRFRLSGSTIESCAVGVEVAENASDTLLERNRFLKNRIGVRFSASGHNTVVANNEFREDQDTGLWAVRSAPDSHDEVIGIHDNKFTEDATGIVAGNIPVLVERNDFINAHEADIHLVGAGAVIRGNRIDGGASMGIVAENARGAIIDDNELEGLTAYGVMVRGSSNTLVRANRLHNCGYGLAFVLGDAHEVSTAVDNTIIEPKFNGIDVIGDSPILRRNQVLRPHAYALHVEDFQPPNGLKVHSQPFLDNNNFGNSPISRSSAAVAARSRLQ